MKTFLEPLKELAEYNDLRYLTDNPDGITAVAGCMDSQKAHLICGLSEDSSLSLIISYEEKKAKDLYEDCRFYRRQTLFYPARDLLFFHADIHGNLLLRQRMRVVKALLEKESLSVVTTIDACMDSLKSLDKIRESLLTISVSDVLDVEDMTRRLVAMGYEREVQVELPGQFALRGGILDIYALTEDNPWRVELWDDEVDSIRSFDAASQRSLEALERITIYPASEEVGEDEAVSFLDYFPDGTKIFLDEPNRLAELGEGVEREFTTSVANRREKGEQTLDESWLTGFDQLQARLNERGALSLSVLEPSKKDWRIRHSFTLNIKSTENYNGSFDLLVKDLKKFKEQGFRIILFSASRTRAGRLAKDLTNEGIPAFCTEDYDRILLPGEMLVAYGHAHKGFSYPAIRFAIMTESEIFGRRDQGKKKKAREGKGIRSFNELSIGDYVIHEKYGIGIYKGIEQVEMNGAAKDYVKIQYQGSGAVYVPATGMDVLQKYAGSDTDSPPQISKLGSPQWTKTKTKVKKAVAEIARDLVELYAQRQQKEGYVCGPDTTWQREFEELFPYEETPDQLAAIEDTKQDMESTKIMDRLICGDVGYGKTEVALRAAFKEVQESRQVVYLVPTTILAQQHYNTFVERMKDFPVRVDLLCRFRTSAQQKKTIEDLGKGLVDIVIGTHRVLSKDIHYKNLGLLIIDEEQRFGVTHKEKIKQLRKDVDVLTLTATPIPRTLHMSLIGIRDMSVLEEPPLDRVPIQTYVMEYDEETVREAISRELRRQGQVYYVYNRVVDIADIASRLSSLVPEAKVGYAHGQMSERELEDVMFQFIEGELDVLVSTTIIETGLDISNVNTMIIHDSDRYGLSQLYQLRGRIGRSNRTAYAFLMYKKDKVLKETAEKRLAAIREYTDLGSGFRIAMRDLELRGAGNILGAAQHGHMLAVGYDLYCKMLSEAVREAKGLKVQEDFETVIELNIDAFIPNRYIPNEFQKLDVYKRIAAIEGQSDYEEMLDELVDRFGEPPRSALNLLAIALAKALAHQAYVTEIRQSPKDIRLKLLPTARLDDKGIWPLLNRYRRRAQFVGGAEPCFVLIPNADLLTELITFVRELGSLAMEG